MTASEARKLSEEAKGSNIENQYVKFIDNVRVAASKGLLKVTVYDAFLFGNNKKRLEENGFGVTVFPDRIEISW